MYLTSITSSIIVFSILIAIGVLTVKKMDFDLMNTINEWMGSYCQDQAVFDPKDYKWTRIFRKNWRAIRNEYRQYVTKKGKNTIPYQREINEIIGDCDSQGNKWRTLYLRAYNRDTKLIQHFPFTKSLIDRIPCTLAYFSILEPGAKLDPHVGLYKGVVRYHLGLRVPKDNRKCYINVNNHFLHWEKGKDIMFDDTYLHYVENNTNEERIVLFLDIRRNFDNWIVDFINLCLLYFIKSNDILDQVIQKVNECS